MILETIPLGTYPRSHGIQSLWRLVTDQDHDDIAIVFMEDGSAWSSGWGREDDPDIRRELVRVLKGEYRL